MLKRKIESVLEEWRRDPHGKCLVIKGARQVGKTYSVTRFLRDNYDDFAVVDFGTNRELFDAFGDDLSVDSIIERLRIILRHPLKPGTPIFMDEIQECPGARTSLKNFAVDGRYPVIASGSILGLHYREVPMYPVGYERVVEMRSLDFEEFLWAIGIGEETTERIRDIIRKRERFGKTLLENIDRWFTMFAVVGGMPSAVNRYLETRDLDIVRAEQQAILEGFRTDTSKYLGTRGRNSAFACFDSLPDQLTQENKKFMYSRIGGSIPANAAAYSEAIQWIAVAGIAEQCHNLTEPALPLESRVVANQFKIYIRDTGLLMSMYKRDVAAALIRGDRRVNNGGIMENLVAECISKCGHRPLYFGTKTMEVDFITVMRGTVTAMEVKSGNNRRSKSLRSIRDKYGVKRRMKFEITDIEVDGEGVEHYPLFACAFIDSMYDEPEIVLDLPEEGEMERLLDERP